MDGLSASELDDALRRFLAEDVGPGDVTTDSIVPEGAVVVPGARHVTSGRGPEWGLSVATPVIVKYRDEHTDARTALEEGLR